MGELVGEALRVGWLMKQIGIQQDQMFFKASEI